MFKASMQYFVKSIRLTLLVFHCFPAEDLCIWWNVTSSIHHWFPTWHSPTVSHQEMLSSCTRLH